MTEFAIAALPLIGVLTGALVQGWLSERQAARTYSQERRMEQRQHVREVIELAWEWLECCEQVLERWDNGLSGVDASQIWETGRRYQQAIGMCQLLILDSDIRRKAREISDHRGEVFDCFRGEILSVVAEKRNVEHGEFRALKSRHENLLNEFADLARERVLWSKLKGRPQSGAFE